MALALRKIAVNANRTQRATVFRPLFLRVPISRITSFSDFHSIAIKKYSASNVRSSSGNSVPKPTKKVGTSRKRASTAAKESKDNIIKGDTAGGLESKGKETMRRKSKSTKSEEVENIEKSKATETEGKMQEHASNVDTGTTPLASASSAAKSVADVLGDINNNEDKIKSSKPRAMTVNEILDLGRGQSLTNSVGADDYSGSGGSVGEEYKSSAERKQERLSKAAFLLFFAGCGFLAMYSCRPFTEAEMERFGIVNGYSPIACYQRLKSRINGLMSTYQDPVFDKLLPDPLPEPYRRNLTLLLELEDVLIHSEWTRENGWRTAKRPGLDYFLGYLSQYYEIIIFTDQYMGSAFNIIQKLDPYHNLFQGALFREAAKYENGKLIKDLSYMNRPLEKIVMIDSKPESWSKQPDNAIKLKPWKGNAGDRELIGLLPFLEYLAFMNVDDVRPVLSALDGKHIPTEYAKREQALRDQIRKNWEEEQKRQPVGLGRLLGLRSTSVSKGPPPLLMDQQRQLAQKSYQEMQQYLKENGAEILEKEKQRDLEATEEFKSRLFGSFGRGTESISAANPVASSDGNVQKHTA